MRRVQALLRLRQRHAVIGVDGRGVLRVDVQAVRLRARDALAKSGAQADDKAALALAWAAARRADAAASPWALDQAATLAASQAASQGGEGTAPPGVPPFGAGNSDCGDAVGPALRRLAGALEAAVAPVDAEVEALLSSLEGGWALRPTHDPAAGSPDEAPEV